jgi:hypothetical protein
MVLAPGHHLYRTPDGSWRYSGPADRFVRVNADDALLSLVARAAATGAQPPATAGLREGVDRVRAALLANGVLTDAAAGTPSRLRVHLEGDTPVVRMLADLLGDDVSASGPVEQADPAATDVLVTCAQWLPDRRWQDVDDWCQKHSVAWHSCYAEADCFVVGPLWIPGRTASYRDTRGRRLAAASMPDELRAHWSYLDSGEPTPTPAWTPATVALVAGLIAADLEALRAGCPPPSEGHQLVLDVGHAALRRHRVLPLPRLAGPTTPDGGS